MKKLFLAVARPVCRLIVCFLWQLIWLLPVAIGYFYGKSILPTLIRKHFAVDQLQDQLVSLDKFAEVMKNNSSLTNPSAAFQYITTLVSKFSVSAKLNTLEMTSDILQSLAVFGLNLLAIIALIYAVIRTFRLYRSKTETFDTAAVVVAQLHPQLQALHQEILALQDELQKMKEQHRLPSLNNKTEKIKLTHG